ncbi:MAG: tRNA-intron lyase [archaeon]|nr:tRNA-intron lyase [archaeon]
MAIVLSEDKVFIRDMKLADQLRQRGFGEQKSRELVLDLFEALYLLEREKIGIEDAKTAKNMDAEEFIKHGAKKIKSFYTKFQVFTDLRERGFVVKTGFKFGFDFRVYPRGKKPGEAHSQWCVNVTTQGDKFTFTELSRMVRLSGNLKTKLLNAVVDSENEVNYYEVNRVTP